jgi:hypothetical protein
MSYSILGLERSSDRTSRRSAYFRFQVIGVLALPADDAHYNNLRQKLGRRNAWKVSNYAGSIIDSKDTWSWSFTSAHHRYLIQRTGSLRRLVAMKKLKLCFDVSACLEVSPCSETSRRPASMRTRSSTAATHNLGGSRRCISHTQYSLLEAFVVLSQCSIWRCASKCPPASRLAYVARHPEDSIHTDSIIDSDDASCWRFTPPYNRILMIVAGSIRRLVAAQQTSCIS